MDLDLDSEWLENPEVDHPTQKRIRQLEQPLQPPRRAMLSLWPHLERGKNAFNNWSTDPKSSRQAVIAMAPITGSTTLLAACVNDELARGGKVIWVVKDLLGLEQAKNAMVELYEQKPTIEQAKHRANLQNNLVITLAQTLKTDRLKQFVENCHTAGWSPSLVVCEPGKSRFTPTKSNIVEAFPDSKVLNATPSMTRSDVKGYLPLGTELLTYTKKNAIDDEILVPTVKAYTEVRAEYLEGDGEIIPIAHMPKASIKRQVLHEELVLRDVCSAMDKEMSLHPDLGGPPLKTLVFVGSNSQGETLAEELSRQGQYSFAQVYDSTPKKEVDRVLGDYKNGKIDILINNMCLKESFSDPGIKMVVYLRPSSVEDLVDTCIARGQLPQDGKKKLVVMNVPDQAVHAGRKVPVSVGLPNESEVEAFKSRNNGIGSTALVFLSWFKKESDLRSGMPPKDSKNLLDLGAVNILDALSPTMQQSLPLTNYTHRVKLLEDLIAGRREKGNGEEVIAEAMGVPKPFTEGTGVIISKFRQAGWIYSPHEANPDLSTLTPQTGVPDTTTRVIRSEVGMTADRGLKSVLDEIFTRKLILSHQRDLFCELRERDGISRFWFKPWKASGKEIIPIANFVYMPQMPGDYCYWVRAKDTAKPLESEDLWVFTFDRSRNPTHVAGKKLSPKLQPPSWRDRETGKITNNSSLDLLEQKVRSESTEGIAIQKYMGLTASKLASTEVSRVVGMSLTRVGKSEANRESNGGESDFESIARLLTEYYEQATQ